jgi:hypothetical protein
MTGCSLRIPAGGQASRSALGIRPFQAPAPRSAATFSPRPPHLPLDPDLMTQSLLRATAVWTSASGTQPRGTPSLQAHPFLKCPSTGGLPGVLLFRVYRIANLESPIGDHPPARSGPPGIHLAHHAPRSFNRLAPGRFPAAHMEPLGSCNPSEVLAPFWSEALRPEHTGL